MNYKRSFENIVNNTAFCLGFGLKNSGKVFVAAMWFGADEISRFRLKLQGYKQKV